MINKKLIESKQYDVKCPYTINPIGISIHNTGNTATAQNERDNLNWTRDERSFHYVSDEKETIQCIENNKNSWANGDYSTGWHSKNYINWEISQLNYNSSESMAVKDIASILKKYGWGVDRIKRHIDFTPSSGCPSQTNKNWSTFLRRIQNELDQSSQVSSGIYRVQVGAFASKSNAEKLAYELKQKGYQCYITN